MSYGGQAIDDKKNKTERQGQFLVRTRTRGRGSGSAWWSCGGGDQNSGRKPLTFALSSLRENLNFQTVSTVE